MGVRIFFFFAKIFFLLVWPKPSPVTQEEVGHDDAQFGEGGDEFIEALTAVRLGPRCAVLLTVTPLRVFCSRFGSVLYTAPELASPQAQHDRC